jgi:hypothetical protein
VVIRAIRGETLATNCTNYHELVAASILDLQYAVNTPIGLGDIRRTVYIRQHPLLRIRVNHHHRP